MFLLTLPCQFDELQWCPDDMGLVSMVTLFTLRTTTGERKAKLTMLSRSSSSNSLGKERPVLWDSSMPDRKLAPLPLANADGSRARRRTSGVSPSVSSVNQFPRLVEESVYNGEATTTFTADSNTTLIEIHTDTRAILKELQTLARRSKDNAQGISTLKQNIADAKQKDNIAIDEIKNLVSKSTPDTQITAALFSKLDDLRLPTQNFSLPPSPTKGSFPLDAEICSKLDSSTTTIIARIDELAAVIKATNVTLHNNVETVQKEIDSLNIQKATLSGEVGKLEAVLSLRQAELQTLDSKANAIERKLIRAKAVIDSQFVPATQVKMKYGVLSKVSA